MKYESWQAEQEKAKEAANKARSDTQTGVPKKGERKCSPVTPTSGKTRKARAKKAKTSPAMMAMAIAETVKKNAPHLHKLVTGGKLSLKKAYRQLKREAHAAKVKAAQSAPKPNISKGPFDLIIADPPWRYEHCEADNREIENQYPTATLEDIFKHSPNAKPDSILFLWATAPKLDEALQVMKAWGYSYRSCAVWDKQKIGMGYWFRIQHELPDDVRAMLHDKLVALEQKTK